MLLTDEEICARFENSDGTWVSAGKLIEAAVLAKLREQKPVAYEWVEEEKGLCISHNEPPEYGAYHIKPLFLNPAPIPEGMTLVPTKILDVFPEINQFNYNHDDVCTLNDWAIELTLAAARSGE